MPTLLPDWFLFASDAATVALAGVLCIALAVIAFAMDRRRHRRDRVQSPDRVGLVPWTGVYMVAATLGGGLLAASLPALLGR